MKYIINFEQLKVSENLKYHIQNDISVFENIFRSGSESFNSLLNEARELYKKGVLEICDDDKVFFDETDLGIFDYFEGVLVPLDLPQIEDLNEAEYHGKEVKLNKPSRSSGPKKYKVYVKNPKTGKVIKVNFGDKKGGLTAKINNPEARKRYKKRHAGDKIHDKTKAGYWSMRLPRYAKALGLAGGGNTYW